MSRVVVLLVVGGLVAALFGSQLLSRLRFSLHRRRTPRLPSMDYDWRDFKARIGGEQGARAAFERVGNTVSRGKSGDRMSPPYNTGIGAKRDAEMERASRKMRRREELKDR